MSKSVSGADRFNLMLALTGHLINNRRQNIEDLAKRFGVSKQAIRAAAVTISLSGIGKYRPDELFFLDYDLLEQGIVDLSFAPTLDSVPRLSARQAAAICYGLSYLSGILADEDRSSVNELLAVLGAAAATARYPELGHESLPKNIYLLREALANQKRIQCQYLNAKAELTQRDIDPHSITSSDDIWYLRGYCHLVKAERIFRIDRMRDLRVLKADISEPASGSTDEPLYQVSDKDTEVIMEVEPEGYGFLADYLPEQDLSAGGVIRVSVPIGNLTSLGRIVARYSNSVRVIGPKQARLAVAAFARRALGFQNSLIPE